MNRREFLPKFGAAIALIASGDLIAKELFKKEIKPEDAWGILYKQKMTNELEEFPKAFRIYDIPKQWKMIGDDKEMNDYMYRVEINEPIMKMWAIQIDKIETISVTLPNAAIIRCGNRDGFIECYFIGSAYTEGLINHMQRQNNLDHANGRLRLNER